MHCSDESATGASAQQPRHGELELRGRLTSTKPLESLTPFRWMSMSLAILKRSPASIAGESTLANCIDESAIGCSDVSTGGAAMAASVASGAGSKACVGAPGSAAAAAGVVFVSSPAVADCRRRAVIAEGHCVATNDANHPFFNKA